MNINYQMSPTTQEFHNDDTFVRALMGPIGSGKSVACIIEMWLKAMNQEPDEFGHRKSRWLVARNTYRELLDTTMQTFFDWFPQNLGILKKMDMKFLF